MFLVGTFSIRMLLWRRFRNTKRRQYKTRRPCCRRELPRYAGHLYRKLAPNPRATRWIETSLKLSAKSNRDGWWCRTTGSDLQHCWRRVCLPARQCTRASRSISCVVIYSAHQPSQQSRPKSSAIPYPDRGSSARTYQISIQDTDELRRRFV